MKRKAAGPSAVPKVGPPKVSSPLKAKAPAPPAKVPENDGDESSDDELLLTSENRPATPTPIRTSGSRIGTPRMVLDSVGIRTPRHLLNSVKRSYGSPTPTGAPARAAPLGTLRLPSAASGSPVKRNVPLPPSSALRQRALRTPSPEPAPPPPVSPTRIARKAGAATPSKRQRNLASQRTDGLPRDLPEDLHPLLERQKRAILRSLQQPPEIDEIEVYGEDYPPTNTLAYEQLRDLLTGSVVRGEGNSCLLIGPSGSGKTQMVERAIAALPAKPIIVRLSGYAQHNDRLAIREIAWQLAQQTGTSFLPAESDEPDEEDVAGPPALVEQGPSTEVHDEEEGDDDENPFVDHARVAPSGTVEPVITLPPPSHLLALISMIPTLPRPTVIVLDGFDLFASHARQALLYCLLDTAQACRTGTGAGSGMAVVGVTARVDTINILEKRVKSRFSGRMIRTACPTLLDHWVALAKAIMGTPPVGDSADGQEGGDFVEDEGVVEALRDVYALRRDFQIFRRIMTCLTLELTTARQRCPARYPQLHTLPYPAICLLIAQVHAQTSGHDAFTFEMLHDAFKSQVRTSQAAPVQLQGGGVGMVRCSREVLFSAFERLVDLRIFLPTVSPAASIAKEFTLHRSAVDRAAVKKAVDQVGQMSLRKWFTKA
ncbi:AAA ATPase domain-containing protein [Cerioporus squamosus]|nr:AAA ATPase domain-containing protein [Cerioporus squamosus]